MKILFIGSLNKHSYSYLSYKILKQKYKTVETLDTDKIPYFKRIITKGFTLKNCQYVIKLYKTQVPKIVIANIS